MSIANEVREQHREKVDAKKPHVIVEEEKESTSLEPEEKKEEVETVTEMNFWGEMHELNNETEPYILEVEGTSDEYGIASKGKKLLCPFKGMPAFNTMCSNNYLSTNSTS